MNPKELIEKLREKWREIPATRLGRAFSSEMLAWSDADLLAYWEQCRRETVVPGIRGWYQSFYRDSFRGAAMLDLGPGLGLDGIFFAEHGAEVTFADIVEDNLKLLERICRLKKIDAKYYFIRDLHHFEFPQSFDVVMAIGSLINAPFDFTQQEVKALMDHLKPGGRVLFLGYPKERFVRSGAKDEVEFAVTTDGERTPWAEWYDAEKIKKLFGDGFSLKWHCNFREDQFNWFELEKKVSPGAAGTPVVFSEPRILQVPSVGFRELQEKFGFKNGFVPPQDCGKTDLAEWNMDRDDVPVLRYLFQNFDPKRHLEFGTWNGKGTKLVLDACGAHVWTINLWGGEVSGTGQSEYGGTDAKEMIGLAYLDAGLGNRVDQIYSDSRLWDDAAYPDGFFDSVFVDGGHDAATARADIYKALRLLRPGGLLLAHDFCPKPEVNAVCSSTVGVTGMISEELPRLKEMCDELFWIEPSWVLCGVRRREVSASQKARERMWFDEARKAGVTAANEAARERTEPRRPAAAAPAPVAILEMEGKHLADFLEWNGPHRTDTGTGHFTARSSKDHLATRFFPVPAPRGSVQTLLLRLGFGPGTAPAVFNGCLQNRESIQLVTFRCEPQDRVWNARVRLPGDPKEVRLVLWPHDLTPHSLPVLFRVESEEASSGAVALTQIDHERMLLKEQCSALLASRWRKIGRKLGIVKKAPFED